MSTSPAQSSATPLYTSSSIDGFTPLPSPTLSFSHRSSTSSEEDRRPTEATRDYSPSPSLVNYAWDSLDTQPGHAIANRLRIVLRSVPQAQAEEEKIAHELRELQIQREAKNDNKSSGSSSGSKGNQNEHRDTSRPSGWYRRKTWPSSYQSLRRTVTGIWHHKEPQTAPTSTSSVGSAPPTQALNTNSATNTHSNPHPSPSLRSQTSSAVPCRDSPPTPFTPVSFTSITRASSVLSLRRLRLGHRSSHSQPSSSSPPSASPHAGETTFPRPSSKTRLRRPSLPFRTPSLRLHTTRARSSFLNDASVDASSTGANYKPRRSRSFSDFGTTLAPLTLTAIADDDEEGLDESTLEASRVAVDIRRRWVFDE